MRRIFTCSVLAVLLGLVLTPSAFAQQTLSLQIGGFVPRGSQTTDGTIINDRDVNDVLAADIPFLDFNLKDFNGPTFNGEWLFGVGDNIEAGLGIGYYSRTVPSVYANVVNSDGTDIQQDLKLRVVPFTATVRWLPMGRRGGVVPYLGAGLGVFSWRYQETGQFVDTTDNSIFSGTFTGSGSTTGPVVLGGVRIPIDNWGIGGEIRYQHAKGNLPGDQGFAGTTIDLSGFNYMFTINFRF
jgi:outer membrane protein W